MDDYGFRYKITNGSVISADVPLSVGVELSPREVPG